MSALFWFFVLMAVTGVICLTVAEKLLKNGNNDACLGFFAASASSGFVAMLAAVILFGYAALIVFVAAGVAGIVMGLKEAHHTS